jgi:hypothetical protein
MTGALHQLGYLASYATEMFDGLFTIAKDTNARIKDMSVRCAKVS